MPRLTPCPSCSSHVLVEDRECPHCGATLRTIGAPRVAAVVVGLALGGCIVPQPAYGIPDPSGTGTGTDGTADAGTDTGETDAMTTTAGSDDSTTVVAEGTSSGDSTMGSTSIGEPEYGVPETSGTDSTMGSTSVGEPEYGVPETSDGG